MCSARVHVRARLSKQVIHKTEKEVHAPPHPLSEVSWCSSYSSPS